MMTQRTANENAARKRRISFEIIVIMYQSNRTFNIPPGITRAFDAFPCPGGRAFDHYSLGVGNLIASLDIMLRVALISRGLTTWRRRRRQTLMNSKEKIVWRIGLKPKAYTSFFLYLKVFNTDLYLYLNM